MIETYTSISDFNSSSSLLASSYSKEKDVEFLEEKGFDESLVPCFVCCNSSSYFSRSLVETVLDSTSFRCFSTEDFNVST